MARILCLHGMGCNPVVLKWQLAPFLKALGPNEYFFLEGELDCAPAPGMEGVAPPPHLCYYNTISTLEVANAHEQVLDFIEDEGPFDGVIGFSQGAALAASLLLHQALNRKGEKPIFNFAIFFAANLPFSPDLGLYREAIAAFLADHPEEGTAYSSDEETPPSTPPTESPTRNSLKDFYSILLNLGTDLGELVPKSIIESENGRAIMAAFNAPLLSEDSCRPYHVVCTEAKIAIPTLHVVGKADDYYSQGKDLWQLCKGSERVMVEHAGGHEIPREEKPIKEIVSRAQSVIERGNLVASGILG